MPPSLPRSLHIPGRLMFCLILMLMVMVPPATADTTDKTRENFQSILKNSLTDLWTGREFSPELRQRQQVLISMMTSNAVTKAELAAMIDRIIFDILNQEKTSRYILKSMPERVNALLSPFMDWMQVKEIIWRSASSVVDKKDPLIITNATLAPPGTPWLTVPQAITLPEIERLSGGKVQIKIYGAGVMGEDTQVLKKMSAGQIDGCGCTALGMLAACPDATALLMPGLFNNYEEVDFILNKFRKQLDAAFEKKGYIVVAFIDTGFFYLFSKNKISGLDKLKEQRIMVLFGDVETAFYQELGIDATHVNVPDAVAALNSGQFDTYLAPAAWVLGMQAYQYVNYYLTPPLLYSPAAVFISTDAVNRLQKQAGVSAVLAYNVQELIISEFNAVEPEWKRQLRHYEEKSLKAFESKCGMKALSFSPQDLKTIEQADKAVQQKLSGKLFPKKLIDDIQDALQAFRSTHESG